MTKAHDISGVLSRLIGIAEDVINRRTARDRIPDLCALDAQLDDASSLTVEGGNPIGPEASMLIETLAHVEKSRATFDSIRLEKWLTIASALLPMVRNCGAKALDLLQQQRHPSTSEGAGGGAV